MNASARHTGSPGNCGDRPEGEGPPVVEQERVVLTHRLNSMADTLVLICANSSLVISFALGMGWVRGRLGLGEVGW